jgi:hypothetical protein
MTAQKQISTVTQKVKSQQRSFRVLSVLIAVKSRSQLRSFVALSLQARLSVLLAVGRLGLQGSTMASWQSAQTAVRSRLPLSVGVRASNRLLLWLATLVVGSLRKFTCRSLAFCSAQTFTLRPINRITVKATKFAAKTTEPLTAFPLLTKRLCLLSIVATLSVPSVASPTSNLKQSTLASAKLWS